MTKYGTHECNNCGLRRPANLMKKKQNTSRSSGRLSIGTKGLSSARHISGTKTKKTIWVCAHRAACDDPDYFVRLAKKNAEEARIAEEKKKEEARIAEEEKKEEARIAEERKRRNDRIDREIRRQKNWTSEIADCKSDIARRKSNFLSHFSAMIFFSILGFYLQYNYGESPEGFVGDFHFVCLLLIAYFSCAMLFYLFPFLKIPFIKRRISVLQKKREVSGSNVAEESFASNIDFSEEIADCKSDINQRIFNFLF